MGDPLLVCFWGFCRSVVPEKTQRRPKKEEIDKNAKTRICTCNLRQCRDQDFWVGSVSGVLETKKSPFLWRRISWRFCFHFCLYWVVCTQFLFVSEVFSERQVDQGDRGCGVIYTTIWFLGAVLCLKR